MLENINNIALHHKIFYDKNHHFSKIVDESNLSESVFSVLKKVLLNKEIEFLNISTEDKKNNDKNIMYACFAINNLLNFMNEKKENLNINNIHNFENKNIKKKKIVRHKNIFSDLFFSLKKRKNNKINQKKHQILDVTSLFYQLKKNKDLSKRKNVLNNINKKNILNSIKLNNFYDEIVNFYKINKDNNIQNIENQKNLISLTGDKNYKNYKNNLFFYKDINSINNLLRYSYSRVHNNQKKLFELNEDQLFLNHSENSIEWKKSINKKILLSIASKDNQAEIYLKSGSLGPIYIKINIKDNQTTLNFISIHNEIRTFLNDYAPILKDSLKRNGIQLDKINISSLLKSKKIKNSQNTFYVDLSKEKKNLHQKNIKMLKYQFVDVYV